MLIVFYFEYLLHQLNYTIAQRNGYVDYTQHSIIVELKNDNSDQMFYLLLFVYFQLNWLKCYNFTCIVRFRFLVSLDYRLFTSDVNIVKIWAQSISRILLFFFCWHDLTSFRSVDSSLNMGYGEGWSPLKSFYFWIGWCRPTLQGSVIECWFNWRKNTLESEFYSLYLEL